MINSQIFRRIVITEKSNKLMKEHQQIVFIVDWRAKKPEIKQMFEEIFGYKVKSVNVMRRQGHPRRIGKYSGKTNRYKKAIVSLAPGQKFDFLTPSTGSAAAVNEKMTSVKTETVKKTGFFARIQDQLKKITQIDAAKIAKDELDKKKKKENDQNN